MENIFLDCTLLPPVKEVKEVEEEEEKKKNTTTEEHLFIPGDPG